MPYTHTTLSAAVTILATRLQDPNSVYWTVPELSTYIVEALRTWQALTGFYRDKASVSVSANTPFYDLTTSLSSAVFGYNVLDADLVSEIEYHFLEAQAIPWAGTDQFTLAEITQAIQKRQDQFLVDTGCVVTRTLTTPTFTGGVAPLDDKIIDIRRAAWKVAGIYNNLWRIDEFAADSFFSGWDSSSSGIPGGYSVAATPPVSIRLIPAPSVVGQLELLSVMAGPTLNPTGLGAGIPMGVPDDFTWGVKFGAMADLLFTDGQSRDPARAAYCEMRYRECVELAKLNPSVVQFYGPDNFTFPSGSVFELDTFDSNWQNNINGFINWFGMCGRNIVAASYPVATPTTFYVDVVRNMPVPVTGSNYLQIGRESLDALIDYAHHLACFKMGGAEFQATTTLYQNFVKLAALQNSRLQAANFYKTAMEQPSQKQEMQVERAMQSYQLSAANKIQ